MYGGYFAFQKFKSKIENFYDNLSKIINCSKSEISFLPSSTYGWNFFVDSIIFKKNENVIIFNNEYGNNFLSLLKKKKLKIKISNLKDNGLIDLEDLKSKIDVNTRMICACHIASQNGNIIDVERIGELKKINRKIIFLLDACQSIGHINIDVQKINCDALVGSGRKYLRGPRGTGFIFIKNKLKNILKPSIFDSSSAYLKNSEIIYFKKNYFETFENPSALIIGLAESLKIIKNLGMRRIEKKIIELSLYFREKIKNNRYIIPFENINFISGINTIHLRGLKVEETYNFLIKKKILTSICTKTTSYHFFKKKKISKILRISFHHYNSFKEIDYLVKILNEFISIKKKNY